MITVEVVHEALIRHWGELREWMNTDRVFRTWQEGLRSAKRQWEATNKDPGSLLHGLALAEAEVKLTKRPEDLIDEEEFIRQSIQERIAQQKAKRIVSIGGIVLGLSLVTAIFAAVTGINAREQIKTAKRLEQQGISIRRQIEDNDYYGTSGEGGEILYSAMETGQELYNIVKDGRPLDEYPAISPLYALQQSLSKFREQAVLKGHQNEVNSVTFSPDGQKLATASRYGTARIWAVEELDEMLDKGCDLLKDYFVEHPESLDSLSSCQDSDGKKAAASGLSHKVRS